MIRRLLIANRGEIARRIIRACRDLGVASVAIYSEADAGALHVSEADAAELVGPPAAADSYLHIPRVIDAARRSGADAVHPGYGFLSERAEFAEACAAAGLIFVGPPADVIRRMGAKTAARDAMAAAGVPVVPGATPATQDDRAIAGALREVGLPALLKAAAGGGGKGMRIVRTEAEIADAIAAARSEALRAFGDGTLYVERLVERARHVEVQILADACGNVVHLFERDCTLQRRHQKVIEEAPAPRLAPAVRARLLAAAVTAARAVGYVNAGTLEFLVDGDGDAARFYFLEMNTRLQVEHPVTEAITGRDLVHAQIRIASGAPLPFTQDEIQASGHAVECRVYAEDPRRLLPQTGRVLRYREPSGAGLRVDAGVAEGQTVTVHYDPLLAKVIAHAPTREQALVALAEALSRYELLGVQHNMAFLSTLLGHPDVQEDRIHTRFIEEQFEALTPPPAEDHLEAAAAMAAWSAARQAEAPPLAAAGTADGYDPFDHLGVVRW